MAATAYTIPARLSRTSIVSRDAAHARQRAITLYRDWYRAAPDIVADYTLNVSPALIRHAIRSRFEKNRYVTDLRAIDVLLLKSQQEYQETMNIWKLPDHIYGIMLKDQRKPQKSFLQKFYEGRDEEGVVPAASGVV